VEREPFSPESLGYPSGHAAVAWAITIIVLAFMGRPWRRVAIVLAIVVPVVRMYVAAHLPLDLIGGAALGVFVASAVSLVLRVPRRATAEDP
jgi:undecaprenyl-diphosphatase